MKNTIRTVIILVLLIVNVNFNTAKAQSVLKRADAQFELFNYATAIELYQKAYQKQKQNQKSLHTTARLADSYRLVKDYQQAEQWYAQLVAMEGATPEATLQYAQALGQNGKYEQAKAQFIAYGNKPGNNANAAQLNLWTLSCDSAIHWMKTPKTATITNQKNLNSERSDWGTGMYNNSIVFVSDRSLVAKNTQKVKKPFLRFNNSETPNRNKYDWTGNSYLSLYSANSTDTAQRFPLNVGTDYHVGPASFSADGKQVYFTLTRIPNKMTYATVGKNKIATINTEIYFSNKADDGSWSTPSPFKYNDVEKYSTGDTFITKDGKKLYFVANMPGGQGGTDINLKDVNTVGNERTPSLDEKGNFYFASDGKIGMGGLDIFSAKINGEKITNVQNMGYPTNSPQDDFAFISTGKLTGFLSSNRTGGLGSDDIYSFTEKEIIIVKPTYSLEGRVLNKETNKAIKGANVQLSSGGAIVKAISGENGEFQFKMAEQSSYSLSADRVGYIRSSTANVSTVGLNKSAVLSKDLYLSEIIIGKAIRIDNIFYDFDKFNIRPDAALELDKLVTTLNENPTIWIELGSHTDSRGNDAYNQKLSQNRANAAVAYIVSKGIAKERITAKGYGETVLVNQCKNGIKCTDEEHQLNRRTEFKIVKQ
jgi:peptidoglycan-associated lipoprotein